ncbi:uncharacterized protein LOC120422798 [Culex pipiens pallens]|uniref:uncharacterized protein LOC120422798 n=1 Tax=Culex pipiens pallens TaxID=42434 RepID=UPI001954B2A0|nr:uncharacterized protein LOC120422798 [Culex pipiens pallens]
MHFGVQQAGLRHQQGLRRTPHYPRTAGYLRIWRLPVYSRSTDNLNISVTLISLITKLALNPNDILLDEYCLLSNQVRIPPLRFVPSRTMLDLPLLPYISLLVICSSPFSDAKMSAEAFEGKIGQVISELKIRDRVQQEGLLHFTLRCRDKRSKSSADLGAGPSTVA